MAERKADPTADANRREAAKWLWGWGPEQRCLGLRTRVNDADEFSNVWCSDCRRVYGCGDHDIPPPDFDDPVVYDRALRELTKRGFAWMLADAKTAKDESVYVMELLDFVEPITFSSPTIGAAIAAAIAELARAEQGKAVGA